MLERERLNGLRGRDHSTPTTAKDLTPRAKNLINLVSQGAFHSMALEGCRGDESNPFYHQSEEALRTTRDQARRLFVAGGGPGAANLHDWQVTFNRLVADEVQRIKDKEAIEAAEAQAKLGEVPAIPVNWGTHAFHKANRNS